jgi:hypothetical protein
MLIYKFKQGEALFNYYQNQEDFVSVQKTTVDCLIVFTFEY